MGIPKLTQTLQPFAQRVILSQSSNRNDDKTSTRSTDSEVFPKLKIASVVIDGPSFVYHVYHRLLSLKASFLSSSALKIHPLQCQPSYLEINQAVLAFVNYLRFHCALEIQGIYFDGALPSSKRDVRLARLEDVRRKLVDLRQFQPDLRSSGKGQRNACPTLLVHSDSEDEDEKAGVERMHVERILRPAAPLPAVFRSLPPPQFMVPAAIEHLRSCLHLPPSETFTHPRWSKKPVPAHPATFSHQHPTIQIVPGEADTYCAAHSQRSGAAILTSDSDLLAYDLGLDGSVIFLNTLELSTSSSSSPESGFTQQVLLGTRYHAPSLSESIGLSCSLQRFCFERSLDPRIATSELKLRCRKSVSIQSGRNKDEEYEIFLRQYSTGDNLHDGKDQSEEAKNDGAGGTSMSKLHLQGLDPRLAELVLQFQSYCSFIRDNAHPEPKAGNRAEADKQENVLHVYLPFLLEDPTRDSAWSYGRDIRCLAYSILACSPTSTTTEKQRGVRIHEYQRRGARIVSLSIDVPCHSLDVDSLTQLLQSLTKYRDRCFSCDAAFTASRFWKSFALTQVAERRRQDGRAQTDTAWARRYLTPQEIPYAPRSWDDVHRQASLNAVLYSLRILGQILRLVVQSSFVEQPPATVRALFEALEDLPPIAELTVAEVMETSQLEEKKNNDIDLVNEPVIGDVHRHFSMSERNTESENRGQSLAISTDVLDKQSWKRAKRRRASGDSRQSRREKMVTTKEVARKQELVRHNNNIFAALDEVGE